VRRTNKRIITQVIHATLVGDRVIACADSSELKKYGLEAGLTNYAAAYCTGLLCARRLLADKGLADMYAGNKKVDGSLYSVMDHVGERRPFKAFLDVGLVRTTTGNRVFGAMKGAADGGLYIPHKDKRFPGFHIQKAEIVTNKRGKAMETEKAKASFDPKEHRAHIFGNHVQQYYDHLKGESAQLFNKQFGAWEKALKGKKFEDIYKAVHAAIRANPVKKADKKPAPVRKVVASNTGFTIFQNSKKKWLAYKRLTHEQRAERVQAKMALIASNI